MEDYERGQKLSEQLEADHRAALDELVQAEELDPAVAEQVQSIYDEAIYHVWRSLATCYEAIPMPDYLPAARGQLMRQADLLAEMAEEGDLDPRAVAQAQTALERDVAFLNLTEEERNALYASLSSGQIYPRYEELDLDVPPQAAQAAAFLTDLLSEQ
jgi:hypothetical protein